MYLLCTVQNGDTKDVYKDNRTGENADGKIIIIVTKTCFLRICTNQRVCTDPVDAL